MTRTPALPSAATPCPLVQLDAHGPATTIGSGAVPEQQGLAPQPQAGGDGAAATTAAAAVAVAVAAAQQHEVLAAAAKVKDEHVHTSGVTGEMCTDATLTEQLHQPVGAVGPAVRAEAGPAPLRPHDPAGSLLPEGPQPPHPPARGGAAPREHQSADAAGGYSPDQVIT